MYFVALLLAGGGLYALGLRGFSHLSLLLIILIPTYWLVLFVTVRIVPADILTGGFIHLPMNDAESAPSAPGRELRFQFSNPGWTVEGALMKLFFLGFAVYMLWTATTAVLYLVTPDVADIRNAPDGFAMRAEIHKDRIAFTNQSFVGWTCDVTIGAGLPLIFKASALLPPGFTRDIRYVDFRPRYFLVEPSELRASAREEIWVQCKEPSGLLREARLK